MVYLVVEKVLFIKIKRNPSQCICQIRIPCLWTVLWRPYTCSQRCYLCWKSFLNTPLFSCFKNLSVSSVMIKFVCFEGALHLETQPKVLESKTDKYRRLSNWVVPFLSKNEIQFVKHSCDFLAWILSISKTSSPKILNKFIIFGISMSFSSYFLEGQQFLLLNFLCVCLKYTVTIITL